MNIFMDSGAFSAFTQKTEVNLSDYIEFLQRNKKYFAAYAALDVIGDAEKTWENTKIMEDAGLSPLPVYHLGTPFKYLHKCMEYDYFCLGGIAKARSNVRMEFLDEAFDEICDDDGMPRNKIHGFGVTAIGIVRRYPFYSVDSTSCIMTGSMGSVYVPLKDKSGFIYDQNPLVLGVSGKSPKKGANMHYDSLSDSARANVDEYFALKGAKLGNRQAKKGDADEGLYVSREQRIQLCIEFFLDFRDSLPEWPWSYEKSKKRRLW